jgi:amino acid transporter
MSSIELTGGKPVAVVGAGLGLRGSLGVGSIVLMVLATAAPLSVMVATSPLLISMGNGAAAPFDAAVGTLIMLLFTAGFVEMSRHITNAGAFYAYVQKGLGRAVGLGAATTALVAYTLILLAVEAYIGYALSDSLAGALGIRIPWWVAALAVVAVVGYLGYRDIELSSKFLGVALMLEIAIVVLVNAAVLYRHGGRLDLAAFGPAAIRSGSPGLGIMFGIYSFIGFEATVIFREEARNPDHTIPRATYLGVTLIGIFYVVSMWCEVTGVGVKAVASFATQHTGGMYLLVIRSLLGRVFEDTTRILLISSLFACALSLHNVVVRYQYVLGRFRILDIRLAAIHPCHGSPHVSSRVQTMTTVLAILVVTAIGLDPVTQVYAWGATAGTLGYLVILSLTCVSILVFFARDGAGASAWNTRLAPLGALVGVLFCLGIAVANLPALIGGENATKAAFVMCCLVACAFGFGCTAALMLKRFRAERFAALKELA